MSGTTPRVLTRIVNSPPIPPRKIVRGVPRDLETIILKALRKEKELRYEDAGAFGQDLQRFLEGKPIAARRTTAAYRFKRLVLRNKAVSAAVAALVVAVVVIAGLVTLLVADPRPGEETGETTSGEVAARMSEAGSIAGRAPQPEEEPAKTLRLPPDLVPVPDAPFAPLEGLAEGSREAQERQRQAVDELELPLEVRTRHTGIVFRLVPAGTFIMGSDRGRPDEKPVHAVAISRPMYLAKLEITQGQWRQIMGTVPLQQSNTGHNIPAERLSWEACRRSCRELCKQEGVPEGSYRMPTEAEWEYSCRAGTRANRAAPVDQIVWHSGNSGRKAQEAGTKAPNAWGLHDMHGNVWEWCQDRKGNYPDEPADDPTGPRTGTMRILRAGSWRCWQSGCRPFGRGNSLPERGLNSLGFRVVLGPELTPLP